MFRKFLNISPVKNLVIINKLFAIVDSKFSFGSVILYFINILYRSHTYKRISSVFFFLLSYLFYVSFELVLKVYSDRFNVTNVIFNS